MSALALGLIAAACWGLHDFAIRVVSQKIPLMASLLTVLIVGLAFHLGMMGVTQSFGPITGPALVYAMLSGVFFLTASLGLYGAFQRGPVRLVAPIIASFPILSVAWAAFNGAVLTTPQLFAVFAVITGVGLVAALADDGAGDVPPKGLTIFYSVVAAVGFAGTFALGQLAAELADHMPAALVTRVTAIVLLLGLIIVRRLPYRPGKGALLVLTLMGIADSIALASIVAAGGLPNAQYASVAASVFGLITIVMAWAFLKERMSVLQWTGCAVTFAGIGYLAL
jgi:drug/metabolite transporter (DMT)-like permease